MTQSYLIFLAVSVIILVNICLIGFNLAQKYNFPNRLRKRSGTGQVPAEFISKLTGGVIFGLIPITLVVLFTDITPAETGFTPGNMGNHKKLLFFSLSGITVLTYFMSGLKNFRNRFPGNIMKEVNAGSILYSATGWITYLFGYELMFRGILWFVCYSAFGFFPALLINLILYSFAHLNQGFIPSLGAIPAGITFCLLSHISGSFLFPFFAHSAMAVSFEIFCLIPRPSLKLRSEIKTER